MTKKMDLTEYTLESESVYEGSLLRVKRDLVRLPDGKTTTREHIVHPGAVMILPLLPSGKLLMERQFRYPLGRDIIVFPAGKIDPGISPLANLHLHAITPSSMPLTVALSSASLLLTKAIGSTFPDNV